LTKGKRVENYKLGKAVIFFEFKEKIFLIEDMDIP